MKYKSNLIDIQINNQLKPWNSYECIPSHQFSSPHRRRTTVWFFQSETGVKKQRTAPSRPNVIPFRASNVTQKLPEVFGQITCLMPSEAKQPLARNLNGFLQVCNLFLELPIVPLAESWNVLCSMLTCNACPWQYNQRTFETAGKVLKSVSANLSHNPTGHEALAIGCL